MAAPSYGLLTIPRWTFQRGTVPRCSVPRRTFQRRRRAWRCWNVWRGISATPDSHKRSRVDCSIYPKLWSPLLPLII